MPQSESNSGRYRPAYAETIEDEDRAGRSSPKDHGSDDQMPEEWTANRAMASTAGAQTCLRTESMASDHSTASLESAAAGKKSDHLSTTARSTSGPAKTSLRQLTSGASRIPRLVRRDLQSVAAHRETHNRDILKSAYAKKGAELKLHSLTANETARQRVRDGRVSKHYDKAEAGCSQSMRTSLDKRTATLREQKAYSVRRERVKGQERDGRVRLSMNDEFPPLDNLFAFCQRVSDMSELLDRLPDDTGTSQTGHHDTADKLEVHRSRFACDSASERKGGGTCPTRGWDSVSGSERGV